MGGKSKPPPAPDYSGIANASAASAATSAQVAREQLAWAREQYASDKVVSDKVVDAALQRSATEDANAAKDRARYQDTYQPLEDSLVRDAQSYATPARQEAEAGKAQADVAQKFDQARSAAQDRLESFGIDPSQTRAAALDISTRTQQAAAQASAGNQARAQTEALGRAMRSEAINVGRGYPGQIAQSYGTALQSGNQAVNAGLATTGSGASTMGTSLGYTGAQNAALGTWSNALNQGFNNQMARYNAQQQQSSGIGSALGLAGGLLTKGLFLQSGGEVAPPPASAIPTGPDHRGIAIDAKASPTHGAIPDDVPARLTAGEYVVPKDVLSWKGEEFFQKLIDSSREKRAEGSAQPQQKAALPQAPTVNTTSAIPMRRAA